MSSTDIAVRSIANLAATRGCKEISADKSHVVRHPCFVKSFQLRLDLIISLGAEMSARGRCKPAVDRPADRDSVPS